MVGAWGAVTAVTGAEALDGFPVPEALVGSP